MRKTSQNAKETAGLAKELFESYPDHKIWLLYGNLGAGKTTFVKGLGEALGMQAMEVKSPTYVLVNEYDPLTHYDLYRIEEIDDLTLELFEEHLSQGKRMVVEWPEKVEPYIRQPHLRIRLIQLGGDERAIEIEAID